MSTRPQLMEPLRESAAQTAPRVRRRLREAFRDTQFTVRANALNQTVTVAWRGAPEPAAVVPIIAPHCSARAPSGGTLWASEHYTLSVVEPLAVVRLERDGTAVLGPGAEPQI